MTPCPGPAPLPSAPLLQSGKLEGAAGVEWTVGPARPI